MATGPETIDYEALQQDALRGVVRAALIQISKTGLPGEHHFFISFLTQSPGVVLSKRLKEKYPHEMTIVLQHRFWDLLINDERFEVKLTFDGIPERLVIPFASIKVFIDPSVRFGLEGKSGLKYCRVPCESATSNRGECRSEKKLAWKKLKSSSCSSLANGTKQNSFLEQGRHRSLVGEIRGATSVVRLG